MRFFSPLILNILVLFILYPAMKSCKVRTFSESRQKSAEDTKSAKTEDGKTKYLALKNKLLGTKSLSESLDVLTAAAPQWFLVHQSFSSQKGSFQYPRAILATDDATLFASFNSGLASYAGHDMVEMIFWDSEKDVFKPSRLSFKDGQASFDESDKKCAACHGSGSAFRPNWFSYPNWPGFYGSTHNTLGFRFRNTQRLLPRGYLKEFESRKFSELKESIRDGSNAAKERYQKIVGSTSREIPRNSPLFSQPIVETSFETLSERMGYFNQKIGDLNFTRIRRIILDATNDDRVAACLISVAIQRRLNKFSASLGDSRINQVLLALKDESKRNASKTQVADELNEIAALLNWTLLKPYMLADGGRWGNPMKKFKSRKSAEVAL